MKKVVWPDNVQLWAVAGAVAQLVRGGGAGRAEQVEEGGRDVSDAKAPETLVGFLWSWGEGGPAKRSQVKKWRHFLCGIRPKKVICVTAAGPFQPFFTWLVVPTVIWLSPHLSHFLSTNSTENLNFKDLVCWENEN